MSIETEFQSTIQNVQNAYNKLDNLGATIPQNKTIENISECLEEIYTNAPKTSFQEGTEVTLSNTLKGKLDYEKIYQEVEYISGTGTQYINTGVLGGLDKKVIIKCSVKSIADYTLYGSRQSTGNTVSYISTASATSSWQSGLGSSWLRAKNNSLVVDEICTIESYLSSGEQYIKKNGTIICSGNREASLATFTQNDYLLAFNNQGLASQMANANLYECKVYQNNVLVRHFIPCYRKTDNVIGLYDKVEGKFYTNAGTGTFTKGADVGSGFGDIVGIGQSEQYSTQGYNLLEPSFESFSSNNVTITDNHNGTYTFNGTASADTVFVFKRNWQLTSNTQYRVSGCPSNGSASTYYIYGINFSSMDKDVGSGSIATTGTSAVTLAIMIKSGVNSNGLIFKPMVVLGTTAKDFEQFTGNSPAPSPTYPYPIQCVTGNIEEVVGGKNLFDKTNFEYLNVNLLGSTTLGGRSASNKTLYMQIQPNKTYTISKSDVTSYFVAGTTTDIPVYNMEYSDRVANNSGTSITITTSANAKYLVVWYYNSGYTQTEEQILSKLQIEENNQATTYEPYHTPTTYPISLGSLEFHGIGTYKDELVTDRSTGKWYKLKNIERTTLNNFAKLYTADFFGVTKQYGYLNFSNSKGQGNPNYRFYCDKVSKSNGVANDYSGYFNAKNFIVIASDNDTITTFNEKVSGSDFCYVLATPTLTEITDTTLINQLEAWYNAKSFTGTVLIQGNGNLPMVIKVRALKGE